MWKSIILDVECIVCNKSLQKISHDPGTVCHKMVKVANNNSRRSRTPNWSMDEKQCLLDLIRERKEVVVTKSNSGPSHSEEKDYAWNQILRELTSRFGTKFAGSSTKKIKTQWQNMKRIAREEISSNGTDIQKYTRQSLQVCDIINCVLRNEKGSESANVSGVNMTANVEIKTESVDEDMMQSSSSCPEQGTSGIMSSLNSTEIEQVTCKPVEDMDRLESSESSVSEQMSESYPMEIQECNDHKTSTATMTEDSFIDEFPNINPLHRELQEYMRYTRVEKELKLESLKEERQVVRAMRETAELNKIIAEQKLKHILWVKKQDMAMYSGEPGSGAGRGGGAGGSIREAGGAFGKMEAAREDEYFYKKQKEQLKDIKSHLNQEINFHEEQIKRHEDAIRRHKSQMDSIEKK